MRTIGISELQNGLAAYLQSVQNGEEIVIEDHNVPIARILPIQPAKLSEHEAHLVASGAMTLSTKKIDWDAFFKLPAGNVSYEVAVQATIDGRGDR